MIGSPLAEPRTGLPGAGVATMTAYFSASQIEARR